MDTNDYPIAERRKHTRFYRHAKLLIDPVPSGEMFHAALINISRGGMLAYTEKDLDPDTMVWIRMEIGSSRAIHATGRMYQTRRDGAVFRFTHIPLRSRKILDSWLGEAATNIRW